MCAMAAGGDHDFMEAVKGLGLDERPHGRSTVEAYTLGCMQVHRIFLETLQAAKPGREGGGATD